MVCWRKNRRGRLRGATGFVTWLLNFTAMRKLLVLVSFFLSLFAAAQKKASSADKLHALDTFFNRVLKEWKAAGFAVAVVEKDKVIYAKGFGYRDVEKKLPVTPNTLFAIGSVTKSFTSSLIGLLQKEGMVEYDKPVVNYIPGLQFYNNSMNTGITLRQMMSHQTGLPRHDFSWYLFPTASRDSVIRRVQYQQPTYGPREKWQYNNFMFTAQGMVAEKLMNTSWEDAIRTKIFEPLRMSRSNFSVKDLARTDDAAKGYGVKGDSIIKLLPYYEIHSMGPAGSINSNVLEMSNWLITWINEGKFDGKEIIPATYRNDAITAQAIVGPGLPTKEKPDVHFAAYGFGWMLQSYRGHYRVEHGGNIDGFSASASFFPTDSIGIIVLSNQNSSSVPSIVRNTIADRLLNLKPYNWHNDLKKSADKAREQQKELAKSRSKRSIASRPTHALHDYEGAYAHPGYGTLDVYVKNDSLFAKAADNIIWLRHNNFNVFDVVGVDPVDGIDTTEATELNMQFQLNTTGEVSALTISLQTGLDPLQFKKQPKTVAVKSETLKKYEGDYELSGATIKVYVKNETLFAVVPNQPEYELAPTGNDRFALKILSGYYVQFTVTDKGEVTDMTFIQPNGNFKAKRK